MTKDEQLVAAVSLLKTMTRPDHLENAINMLRKPWRKTLVGIADYHAADDMEIILIEAKRILEERK